LVGLPCKQNKLLVFDADRHTADEDGVAHLEGLCKVHGPLPPHPIISTDYEGEHHIFRMPSEPIGNRKVGIGLETRGYQTNNEGGYIIAAGSRMPDGRAWELLKGTPSLLDGPPPEPPRWLIELCRAQKSFDRASSPHSTGKREEAYASKALETQAQRLASTRPGNRNNTANSIAYSIGCLIARGWIGAGTVEGRLFDACCRNGLVNEDGEVKVRATLRSGIKAGMQNPHPDLQERPNSAHLNGGQKPSRAFDDPDWSILDDRRGELPELPLEVFSEKIQQLIRRTAKGAGVTSAHVAAPLIGIVSGLIGTARRVKATSSWLQPLTCWTVVVGFSGTGKTPGLNVTRRVLKEVERLNKAADDERKRRHETKKAEADAARKKWQTDVKEGVEKGQSAPLMPSQANDPAKFVPIRLSVSDGTIERLAELVQARPQGIVLARDELSALFTNMSRYSGGQDNEFWLESWNGDSYTVERMQRTLHVDHLLIGVVGGMQPDKLVRSFEGDHDGMYARILFAWPPEAEWTGLTDDATEIEPDILNIISRVNGLAQFADDKLLHLVVSLSSESRERFVRFARLAHQAKEAFEGREREWFAKATAHVLRLAGTITFLEWALEYDSLTPPGEVRGEHMQSAITLVEKYFWPHARACLRQIGLTDRHADARKVLRWIRAQRKTEVSLMDTRRHALNERLDEEDTEILLSHLERTGWVRKYRKASGPAGGKPVVRWQVNPILFSNRGAETAETAETCQANGYSG
jgi:hypothetical protein